MRKERMITRTIAQTIAEIMCIDVTIAQVEIIETKIGGEYTPEELLKVLKKLYETDTYKVVNIQSMKSDQLLLGISESDFIKYATVLPPRTKKVEE